MAGRSRRTVVIGAGFGGLAAAVELARHGEEVLLLERSVAVGGKARAIEVEPGRFVDSGPTVLTMRWVFDQLFAASGASLSEYVRLSPASIIARHAWPDGSRLDLHAAPERTFDEIASFAGAKDAASYLEFARYSKAIWEAARETFVLSERPSFGDVLREIGLRGLGTIARIDGHRTMHKALASYFRHPHLRQLFGRYATYCGGSPFEVPATFNLVAHVESEGVHRVEGGVSELAGALARRACELGVRVRTSADVTRIDVTHGRVSGVVLASGEHVETDTVVCNADVSALSMLGVSRAAEATLPEHRSLSAFTLSMTAEVEGDLPLAHHNVAFSSDYAAEFEDLMRHRRAPREPTVYLCAQDRQDEVNAPLSEGEVASRGRERMLLIINAPATGDEPSQWRDEEVTRCERALHSVLDRCGLRLRVASSVRTTPIELERAFPRTGGALYGPRPRGPLSSLFRAGARTKLPGLYLAGGSVHPGPGVPMVALSGRLAAATILADRTSTGRSSRVAMSGTTSTA